MNKKLIKKTDNKSFQEAENIFEKLLLEIKEFLDSHNLSGYLFILAIKTENGIMVYDNYFKNMKKEETDTIMDDSIIKINDEFSPKYLKPLKLTHTKADA